MALKGVKVIELAGLAPAPFCGMILNDFGATVIKVDKINSSTEFDCLSNGKLSIALNLKHKKGINILQKLCKESDVLLEPFRKGVMEKLGLGPEVLLKDNPRLIYARLTGYGQSGPYSETAGHDINFLALSGLLSLFGRKNENPIFPVNLASDFGGGGLMCALGIVLALFEREKSGLGQIIDNSMVEGTSYLGSWLYRSQQLPIWGQERGSNILDTGAHFYEVYKTKDNKFISVGAIEPQFYANLLKGLQLELENVPQFENFIKNKELFKAKFLEKTQQEWCDIFDKLDACVAPVLSLNEAPEHKHNYERQSFLKKGNTIIPKPAPILNRTPGVSMGLKENFKTGSHTRQILEKLNYSAEDIEKLEKENVIFCQKNSKL